MNRLVLIGNGFDLHHSIPSSYYDYMRWVELRYPMLYDEISRTFTDADKESWWADFEMRLADVECMYNFEVIVYPDYTIEGISMNGRNSAERLAAFPAPHATRSGSCLLTAQHARFRICRTESKFPPSPLLK